MDNWFKWLVSVVCGGLIKAKTIGEGLSSQKGWKGFWKKIALLVGLFFGIYLDYVVPLLFVKAGLTLDIDLPFALIICCYIVLNECISIAENLYLINPDIMPKWIANLLKVAKDKIEDNNKD